MTTNTCIFVLIMYMSVQFCKPIDGQWQQFLLGYREKSLNTYLREQSVMDTDQEKARRFHEAAIEDANRQISIISAFLDERSPSVTEPEDATSPPSDEIILLNT